MLCTQIAGVAIVQLSLQVIVLLSVSWSTMAVDPICVTVNPGPISQPSNRSIGVGQLRKRTVEVGLAEMMEPIRVGCCWLTVPKVKMPKVKMEIVVWMGAWETEEELEGVVAMRFGGREGLSRVVTEPEVVRATRARVRRRVEEYIVARRIEGVK
jgi:hypothetical protein